MTLDSKLSKAVYQGNDSTTVFPFAFKVWDSSQITVTVTDAAGASTDVTSNCTVTLTSSGGSVTYPKTGSPLPIGAKLAIVRNMPFTQGINLTTASRFDPQVLEDGLDQATAERQQILEQMARAVILPPTSNESPEDVVASIYSSRDAAAASASAASNKADAAEGSAQAAANSASTAAQTVTTAAAEAVSAATAQANAAHDSALAAAQSAAEAEAAVPDNLVERVTAVEDKNTQQDARIDDVIVFASTPKYEIGEFYYFRHPTLKPGFAPLQGGLISGAYQGKNITEYPIWDYLQTTEGQLLCKTEAEWQAMSTAICHTNADGTTVGWGGIGGAPFYVQDLTAGTLRMPDLRGMYAEAAGFDSLGVGGVHGDTLRIHAHTESRTTGGSGLGGVGGGTPIGIYTVNTGLAGDSPVTKVRAWGALACAYLGQPAS